MKDNLCNCKDVEIGSYDNQVMLTAPKWSSKEYVCVDACLEGEILDLWEKGIITGGCCCGHNKIFAHIQVYPESIEEMEKLGYEHIQFPQKTDCFKPKSILP